MNFPLGFKKKKKKKILILSLIGNEAVERHLEVK